MQRTLKVWNDYINNYFIYEIDKLSKQYRFTPLILNLLKADSLIRTNSKSFIESGLNLLSDTIPNIKLVREVNIFNLVIKELNFNLNNSNYNNLKKTNKKN